MENLSKEQLEKTIETIELFKKMITEMGSKEAVINHLVNETGLPKKECEIAYDFYTHINLPDKV